MARFFIHRPIFATVLSLLIVIAGLAALRILPIAQYPEVAPPTVTITASYPGASAETLAKTVASPIEEQMNGLDGLLYYNSSSASNGQTVITATFETGTDVDDAVLKVNNQVSVASPRLPEELRRNGVLVQKRSNDILLVVSLHSPDNSFDTLYLSNYASLNVVDALKRVNGVGDVSIFGARNYSMRIWLQPDKMAQRGLTATDVANAIRQQNTQYIAGKIGQEPSPNGQALVYTVTAQGRLVEPEQFGNIILRADESHGVLHLKDVARIELGAQSYDMFTMLDGKSTIGLGVYLQPGANALDTSEAIHAAMEQLQHKFPEGMEYIIPFDTSEYVDASIKEVGKTLLEAAILVVAVVFIFLQTWRATIIPILAVPISIIGTFAGLWLFGFSINTLTLFAMVLSIGIVVDDAIVVLENVERLMTEQKLSPFAAAVEAMREVSGAIVAIVLALCAVFVPVAFLGGIAGTLYQQFAVTVAVSVVISGIVALTLTPTLCAILLKESDTASRLFVPFNYLFGKLTQGYTAVVGWINRHIIIGLLLFSAIIAGAVMLFQKIPAGFVPSEDMGYVIAAVSLPDGATLKRTEQMALTLQQQIKSLEAVRYTFAVVGFDLISGGNKSNAATIFVPLKSWDQRQMTAEQVTQKIFGMGMSLPDGIAFAFNPPPIRGLGTAGGFEGYVQSRLDSDPKKLAAVTQQFVATLNQDKMLQGINSFFRASIPQLNVEVDQEKALSLGVPISDIFDALQSTMGALYVNDFNKFGRTYRVQMQADADYRAQPEDLGNIYVRSATTGAMIQLKVLLKINSVLGPEQIERFNGYTSAKFFGNGATGISSGDAIRRVEQLAADTLPYGYELAWTGQAYQEKQTGSAAALAFGVAILMVFLILAAQYERWSLPIAVLLAIPFALLGALGAIFLRGMPNDIYFQIGLVTLIGLAAKNAILIVEFAAQKQAEGLGVREAALEAARLRFRPIVMTSLAFVFGVLPLVFATGAGAAARQSMGTGVTGGMLAATFIATLFIPLFFTLLSGKTNRHSLDDDVAKEQA